MINGSSTVPTSNDYLLSATFVLLYTRSDFIIELQFIIGMPKAKMEVSLIFQQ